MGKKSQDYYLKKWRAREELKLKILALMVSYQSEEEPRVKLNDLDKNIVLSELITRRLHNKIAP